MTEKPETAERLATVIAQLRRLYLHVGNGGKLTPSDLSRVIASLERISNAG